MSANEIKGLRHPNLSHSTKIYTVQSIPSYITKLDCFHSRLMLLSVRGWRSQTFFCLSQISSPRLTDLLYDFGPLYIPFV
jgi:hypothetical protein